MIVCAEGLYNSLSYGPVTGIKVSASQAFNSLCAIAICSTAGLNIFTDKICGGSCIIATCDLCAMNNIATDGIYHSGGSGGVTGTFVDCAGATHCIKGGIIVS
jgi:hypothetical protein